MLSSRMRRNFACSATLISAISSRKSVPSCASSKQPWRRSSAPVNAPFSWPKISLSSSVSGIAAQLTATKGPRPRGDSSWSVRATSSLPVPLSPVMSTAAGVGAASSINRCTACMAGLVPTSRPMSPELLHAAAQEGDLAERLRLLRRLRDEQLDPRHLHRLGEEVVRAFLHRRHRRVDRPLPGEQDDRGEGDLLGERPQELEPVHPGHDEVADHHRGVGHARLVERLVRRRRPARRRSPSRTAARRARCGRPRRRRRPAPCASPPSLACTGHRRVASSSSRARPLSVQGASPAARGTSARARSRRPGWSRRARDPSRSARRARRPARTSGRDTPAPWSAARRNP